MTARFEIMRRLKPFQLEYIKELNDKTKFRIIELLNDSLGTISDLLNEM